MDETAEFIFWILDRGCLCHPLVSHPSHAHGFLGEGVTSYCGLAAFKVMSAEWMSSVGMFTPQGVRMLWSVCKCNIQVRVCTLHYISVFLFLLSCLPDSRTEKFLELFHSNISPQSFHISRPLRSVQPGNSGSMRPIGANEDNIWPLTNSNCVPLCVKPEIGAVLFIVFFPKNAAVWHHGIVKFRGNWNLSFPICLTSKFHWTAAE